MQYVMLWRQILLNADYFSLGDYFMTNPVLSTYAKEFLEKYYIWRCKKDAKTRSEHLENDGKVFHWDYPPKGGASGAEL